MDLRHLYRISVFQKVAETGNFTRAAQALNLSKSVVSQHVSDLERDLNVRLLNRSTRSVSITQEGHSLADAAEQMIDIIGTAIERLENEQHLPSGMIRITASQNLAIVYLAGAIARFREAHPTVEVELDTQDSITNLIESGYDIAFRIGWLKITELHAVKIADFEMVPCASPAFVRKFGPFDSPMDLSRKPWIVLTIMSDYDRLTLSRNDQDNMSVKLYPSIRTNSGMTAKQFVLNGAGAALLPDYAVSAEIEEGNLVRLLPGWHHRPGEIAATFVHRRRMPLRLRAFIDFLKEDARTTFNKH
ncbi:MAG: LysR family transcriptional regulator [Rhodospirillaceae bacterium]|nr:LysR family transcriptional regulator [Rhodospirillaceae bacterium]